MMNDDSNSDDDVPILVNVDQDEEKETLNAFETTTSSNTKVPVTILSGFLGAGKTTLIQYILKDANHGKRIAVIENEFGGGNDSLQVESMIARNSSEDLIMELPNGCICCTVKDKLVVTLEQLLQQYPNLDYILIEASGMANPGPIATLFWLDDMVESRLRLDGIVTIVDAYYIERQLNQTVEAAQQVAYADRILLNKVDLVSDEKEQDLYTLLKSIQPTASIQSTTYSQIPDLDYVLNTNCFHRAKDIYDTVQRHDSSITCHLYQQGNEDDLIFCQPCNTTTQEDTLDRTQQQQLDDHLHSQAVGTISLVQEGSVHLQTMNSWLASILWPNQDEANSVLMDKIENNLLAHKEINNGDSSKQQLEQEIFRIKGILSVQHCDNEDEDVLEYIDHYTGLDRRRFIVQAVFDLWQVDPAASSELNWNQDEERICKLVIIGRNLQHEELQNGFSSCFV